MSLLRCRGRICCGSTEKEQHWLRCGCASGAVLGAAVAAQPHRATNTPGICQRICPGTGALGELINVCLQGMLLEADSSFSLQMVTNSNFLPFPNHLFPLLLAAHHSPVGSGWGSTSCAGYLGRQRTRIPSPSFFPQVFALPTRLDGVWSIPGSFGQLCCVPCVSRTIPE